MNLKKRVNPTSSCAVNTENMADALYRSTITKIRR